MTPCLRCGGTGHEPDHALIGGQVRSYRRAEHRTLGEVAVRTGLSVQYLSDLERGRRAWNSTLLDRVFAGIGRRPS